MRKQSIPGPSSVRPGIEATVQCGGLWFFSAELPGHFVVRGHFVVSLTMQHTEKKPCSDVIGYF